MSSSTAPDDSAAGDPLFLTCECGRMAQILLGTPWGLGSYCVRCASARDLARFAARRFLEIWPDGGAS